MPKDPTLPGFVLYVDDFSSDEKVEAMTTEEVGAYILLLCKAWRSNPPATIPDDDSVLCRWTRLSPERWAECKQRVLAAFTPCPDSRMMQKRMRQEYDKIVASKKKRVSAAIAAATARYNQVQTAVGVAIAEQSHTERTPTSIGLGSIPLGFPDSEKESIDRAMCTGIPPDFVVHTWNKALGRGGCDNRDVPIRNWVGHLKTEWKYEQERRSNGGAGMGASIRDQLNALESEIQEIHGRASTVAGGRVCYGRNGDQERLEELKAKKNELNRRINGQ